MSRREIVFSDVKMRHEDGSYKGGWYDYSGQEYTHVTEQWLANRLFEYTGIEYEVVIREHGNGHYSAHATVKS